MAQTKANSIGKLSFMALVDKTIDLIEGQVVFVTKEAKPYIAELSSRLGICNQKVALLVCIISQCDDTRIRMRDIAYFFRVRITKIVDKVDDLDDLVRLGFIKRRINSDGENSFRISPVVLKNLRNGILPEKVNIDNLTPKEWIELVGMKLEDRKNNEITDDELSEWLEELVDHNPHLLMVQHIKNYKLTGSELVLFLVMACNFINSHDDRQMRSDIDDYMSGNRLRSHIIGLEEGSHSLMKLGLVEFACCDGKVEPNAWKLTNKTKLEVFSELNLKICTNVRTNLTRHKDIKEKRMFYNKKVTRQVEGLQSLLDNDKMKRVLDKMVEKGMRRGFTCLFYGGPGTGKTETALQLARLTKRDIMMVDIPTIRSKWVGETEQNIKSLFDRYRMAVKSSPENAPILFFNEADAVLNTRNEGGTNAVDKMENAMQNIILQEMEDLEGIMIATTNLTGNLDGAFERRFLYKIEFDKPTPKESKRIWKAMLPDLTDDQSLELARRFNFSGGQIENIVRKRIIDDILKCRDFLDFDSIIENCTTELLNNKQGKKIGF